MIYKAEIFDELQYLYKESGFNDHSLHCVVEFENKIKEKVLLKALELLFETIPILGCVYKQSQKKSYWINSLNKKEVLQKAFMVVRTKPEFEDFITSKIDEEREPQIKVCLFSAEKDSISLIMNHMITDAAGFKQCIYMLAEYYSKIMKNPNFYTDQKIDGNRSIKNVVTSVSKKERLKSLLFENGENNSDSKILFPFDHQQDIYPQIITYDISKERSQKILKYCKDNEVTVNDAFVAAYYRAFARTNNMFKVPITIPIMIDMRKYLKDKTFHTISNLSSTVNTSILVEKNESFEETLQKVSMQMKYKKARNMGLNVFVKLNLIFKLKKDKKGISVVRKHLKNPLICMTNVGIIDENKLSFSGSSIENAFLCGSIKYRPHFQIALSTFKGKVTLSSNIIGTKKDHDNIRIFLSQVEKEIPVAACLKEEYGY